MRILHVVPTYYPATYWGGPVFSVYALNNALARLPGVKLKVITTDAAGPALADRLEPADLGGLYPNQEVLVTRRVARASVSSELLRMLPGVVRWANVVHLTATYSFPTIPTLMLCRLLDKPLVWSPRGAILDAHEWAGASRKLLKRVWEKSCNALIRPGNVIAHATAERERLVTQARVPRARAVIVPNGVDVPDNLPLRDWIPDNRLRLMFLGRLAPKKGIENLLQAMQLLNDPTIQLMIYGTGDTNYAIRLKSLALRLDLFGNAAFFAGHVDGEAKTAAFHGADVCVVPSHSENFCLVVAEALAHGLPVITSRGTPWGGVEGHGCGLWVDNSPDSLAAAIMRIRMMPLEEMGKRGRRWIKQAYSWNTVAEAMVHIYQSLIAHPGDRRG